MTDADLMTRDEPETEPGREIATRSPPGPPATQMLDVIARAAADPRCDVQKMEALLRMQRELMADQAKADFNQDFAAMQPKLPRIAKRGVVDRGPGRGAFPYGKWEDIDETIRPLLNEHGFSLSFTTEPSPQGGVIVTGTLRHRNGHEKSASIGPLPADNSGGKNPVQAAGSTFAYGKRYTTTMLLNLTFEGANSDAAEVDEFIDENSVSQIGALLKETDSNLTKFLENFGIIEVGEMRQSQYPRAINMLLAKKRRMADEASR
jgi:hypothetical protein